MLFEFTSSVEPEVFHRPSRPLLGYVLKAKTTPRASHSATHGAHEKANNLFLPCSPRRSSGARAGAQWTGRAVRRASDLHRWTVIVRDPVVGPCEALSHRWTKTTLNGQRVGWKSGMERYVFIVCPWERRSMFSKRSSQQIPLTGLQRQIH